MCTKTSFLSSSSPVHMSSSPCSSPRSPCRSWGKFEFTELEDGDAIALSGEASGRSEALASCLWEGCSKCLDTGWQPTRQWRWGAPSSANHRASSLPFIHLTMHAINRHTICSLPFTSLTTFAACHICLHASPPTRPVQGCFFFRRSPASSRYSPPAHPAHAHLQCKAAQQHPSVPSPPPAKCSISPEMNIGRKGRPWQGWRRLRKKYRGSNHTT
jgi:hypothetical protein